jgi:phosphoglycerol transferase
MSTPLPPPASGDKPVFADGVSTPADGRAELSSAGRARPSSRGSGGALLGAPAGGGRWLRPHLPALAGALAAATVSVLVAALALNVGEGHLSQPWNYASEGDTKFYLLLIKGILAHGSYQVNPSLGAPFGLQLYDFPQGGDNLSLLLIRVLGWFSNNPAWALNVFFMLTFALVAASAFAAFRLLGVSVGASIVGACIFSLLPYHFYRGESQVLLSAYYGVPLGALLFMRIWTPPGLFARRAGGGGARPTGAQAGDATPHAGGTVSRAGDVNPAATGARARPARAGGWLSGTTTLTVLCCLVVGSTGLYYAVFAILLLLAGSALALVVGRGRSASLSGVLAAALIALTLAANISPTLSYRAAHGANTAIKRTTIEADQFGLRLSDLLLPVQAHRLAPFSKVNQRYIEATSTGYCEACYENLGAVGSIGFLWLALIALVSIAGIVAAVGAGGVVGAAGAPAGRSSISAFIARRLGPRSLYRPAALGVSLSFVLATIGGLSSLIAFFVTRDIRGWNRISLFIAFFSLLAAMLGLDAGLRRLSARVFTRATAIGAGAAVCAAVLAVGIADETTSFFVPKYEKDAKQWVSDATFVREIEARMPQGAAIFQLPYVPFPEGYGATGTSVSAPNPNFGTTYELARGPIHSDRLRWSYGAMKGRPADWQAPLATQPLYLSLAAAAANEFDGLWVDPRGYSTAARPRLVPVLERVLGVQPLFSPAHDLMFFDLRPFAARLALAHPAAQLAQLRASTLHPLRTACGTEGIELTNPSPFAREATLQMRVYMHAEHPLTLLIHYPGAVNEQRALTTTPVRIQRALSLPPGTSTIGFSLAGTPAPLQPRISGPVVDQSTLTEPALTPFLSPLPGQPGLRAARIQAGFVPPPCLQSVEAVTSAAG